MTAPGKRRALISGFGCYREREGGNTLNKNSLMGQTRWLMPIIPAVQEAEIRRIAVEGRPEQRVKRTPSESISQAWQYVPMISATQEA
jgi:hypothetical protein